LILIKLKCSSLNYLKVYFAYYDYKSNDDTFCKFYTTFDNYPYGADFIIYLWYLNVSDIPMSNDRIKWFVNRFYSVYNFIKKIWFLYYLRKLFSRLYYLKKSL
jgi:hypothetical protein